MTQRPIRVLHIISGLATGGAETMLYKLLSASASDDLRHSVVALKGGGVLDEKIASLGVPVRAAGIGSAVSLPVGLGRALYAALRFKPDVLQGWMYHGNLVASLVSYGRGRRVPVLWNIRHSIYDLGVEKKNTRFVIRSGTRFARGVRMIVYNSRVSAAQHEAIGYRPRASTVIPNGFDCERFAPSVEAKTSVRGELGVVGNTVLIGLIARYHPMKDHGNFVRAAKRLAGSVPGVDFVLAGAGTDDDNAELTAMIREHGLRERFHLLGERDDVPRITAALDIATVSSSSESFPNVVGEAMACGVPVAATAVGDTADVIGDTGKVVPPRDPQALARAWEDLIGLGADGRATLGGRARERIAREFSLEKVVSRYERLYRDAARRDGPGGE